MTALAANLLTYTIETPDSIGATNKFKHLAATDIFYQNALVELNTKTGLVAPLGVSGEGAIFIGVCTGYKSVTSGDGQEIPVGIGGTVFQNVSVTGVAAATDVGKIVYCADDNIATSTLTRPSADALPIGKITRWRSSTYCDIQLFTYRQAIDQCAEVEKIEFALPSFTAGYCIGSATTGRVFQRAGKIIGYDAFVTKVPTSNSDTTTLTAKINDTAVATGLWTFLGSANQTLGATLATITQPTVTNFYQGDKLQIAAAGGSPVTDGQLHLILDVIYTP